MMSLINHRVCNGPLLMVTQVFVFLLLQDNSTLAVKLGLPIEDHHQTHPWGIFFTILGTVLLDFDADSCQSPSRAYLLDVTVPGM